MVAKALYCAARTRVLKNPILAIARAAYSQKTVDSSRADVGASGESDPWGNWGTYSGSPSEKARGRSFQGPRRRSGALGERGNDGGNRPWVGKSRASDRRRNQQQWQGSEQSRPVGNDRRRERVELDDAEQDRRDRQVQGQTEVKTARARLRGEVLLYGVAPVLAAVRAGRRELHGLLLQEREEEGTQAASADRAELMQLAEETKLPVRTVSKHVLNTLAEQRPHQGVVLDCGDLNYVQMLTMPTVQEISTSLSDTDPWPLWVALDAVGDPQNLGAILRSAYFFGAAGIIASKKNCAPLTGVASKASAGCLEATLLYSTSNLARTLAQAQADGWRVLGADGSSNAVSCLDVEMGGPTILVLGNEGKGLRTNVRRACSELVRVKGNEKLDRRVLDSLNVSVATGILMHTLQEKACR